MYILFICSNKLVFGAQKIIVPFSDLRGQERKLA